jgi:Ca-activated chloride channel family protein
MKKTLSTALISLCFLASACQLSHDIPQKNESEQVVDQTAPAIVTMEETAPDPRAQLKKAKIHNLQMLETTIAAAPSRNNKSVAPMVYFDSGSFTPPQMNTESYIYDTETGFIATNNDPLSTFSADVDTASYANIRRFISMGQHPPVGAVRIEEMINYFNYNYPQPTQNPIGITSEIGPCPWEPNHKLVQIGIQAVDIDKANLPPSNLVFLIDVSGSMSSPNKLGLLKKSMKMLVKELDKKDRVAIVVYAGCDRIVLNSTSCDDKKTIYAAINNLESGGSTNGAGGIQAAYKLAEQGFMPKGNNRIILASDGDFNIGTTSHGELEKLIETKRETGVFLTVLGFGMGNYHDSTMEVLADKGNGNYAYIDNLLEAKKVLVKEMGGTMHTIAKDVKLQVEFNPGQVAAYRLIGYKNRRLADEDFNNDKKDAGEMGAGHTVTALYEIISAGDTADTPSVDPLKYQKTEPAGSYSNELLTVKVRYKEPKGNTSKLISHVLKNNSDTTPTTDFTFATSVAAFGLKLSDSEYAGTISYQNIIDLAKKGKGIDDDGYRAEFIRLVEKAELMAE